MYKTIYLQGISPVIDDLLPPRESTSDRPDPYQKPKKKNSNTAFRTLMARGSNIQAAKVSPTNQRQVKQCRGMKFSSEFYYNPLLLRLPEPATVLISDEVWK